MIENLPPANGARAAMRGRFRGADFLKVPASSVRMVIAAFLGCDLLQACNGRVKTSDMKQ
jgi:hypothetical protein